jgi:hypothetical protein
MPVAVLAQGSSEAVFYAQPNNTIAKVVDFGTGQTMPVFVVPGTNFQGIVVLPDRVVAANQTSSGTLMVCTFASGTCQKIIDFKHAEAIDNGVAVSALVAVNEKDRILMLPYTACSPVSTTCLPGGYQKASEVSIHGAKKLADVKFARGGSEIFVLMRDPKQLIKIPNLALCGNPCKPKTGSNPNGYSVVLGSSAFGGKTPQAIAFQGDGDLLVATKEGSLLEYQDLPSTGFTLFGTSLGGSVNKLAVGTQQGVEKVFASVQTGSIRCLTETGSPCGVAQNGVNAPDGVGIATGAFVATGVGDDVEQSLAPNLVTRWQEITSEGNSLALCQQVPDPRELTPDGMNFQKKPLYLCAPGSPDCDATPTDYFVNLGLPNVIPKHLRALRPGSSPEGPFTGPPTFQVCVMSTTAGFAGIIEDHVGNVDTGNSWYGYDLHALCPGITTGNKKYPGVSYSPGPDDREIVEGLEFTDVTIECNHPLGGSWGRSVVLNGVWNDTIELPECAEAASKLENLDETLEVHASSIEGACGTGSLNVGGVPGDATNMQAAFDNAFGAGTELANLSNWSLVSPTYGKFGGDGTNGNGFLLGGGSVMKKYKGANYNHQFGWAKTDHTGLSAVIPDDGNGVVNATFAPTFDPYLLYFKNIGTGPTPPPSYLQKSIFSDGYTNQNKLRIAVYQNLDDPTLFALFFDDGALDFDYDDLIVTAQGPVGTRCALEIALADAIEALNASSCTNTTKLGQAVAKLTGFISVIDSNPDDFDLEQLDVELKARALSAIYVIDRKLP